MPPPDDTFDFGFERVSASEKTEGVTHIFERVSSRYDLMNDAMSFGLHRVWKRWFVESLPLYQGGNYLDVAAGTGDIGSAIAARLRRFKITAQISLCDINPAMIAAGCQRFPQLSWVCATAESLPFEDQSMDVYTIAFGLRNVTRRKQALREAYRVLRPGGYFACLEFSQPIPPLQRLYDMYSFRIIPKIGALLAQDEKAYQYLVESIRTFLPKEGLVALMQDVGFSTVKCQTFTGGIVALHTGYKAI